MSEALESVGGFFSVCACSQCRRHIPHSETRLTRHAIPCGHVFCKGCVGITEAEEKSGRATCRAAGCGRTLAPASAFPTAWCIQREERLRATLGELFADQGDAGDRKSSASSAASPVSPQALCAAHGQPITAADPTTKRPMCATCVASAKGAAAVQSLPEAVAALRSREPGAAEEAALQMKRLFDQFPFTPAEFREGVTKWRAEETTRIKKWEEREIKAVQTVAAETVELVDAVSARRLEVGGSFLAQRLGLRTTLEEIEHELSSLPTDDAGRLDKLVRFSEERARLTALLRTRGAAIPDARVVGKWALLPSLARELDGQGLGSPGGSGGGSGKEAGAVAAAAVGAALTRTLGNLRDATPVAAADGSDCQIFPDIVSRAVAHDAV